VVSLVSLEGTSSTWATSSSSRCRPQRPRHPESPHRHVRGPTVGGRRSWRGDLEARILGRREVTGRALGLLGSSLVSYSLTENQLRKRSGSLVTAKWNWPVFWIYTISQSAEYSLTQLRKQ
jgi:hypothetical protein